MRCCFLFFSFSIHSLHIYWYGFKSLLWDIQRNSQRDWWRQIMQPHRASRAIYIFCTCPQLNAQLFTRVLLVALQFVSLIGLNLTRCSSNSLNGDIKSVNTVLFNPQNYFQKASSPLRGHQTRFKVHVFITGCPPHETTAEWSRLCSTKMKEKSSDKSDA